MVEQEKAKYYLAKNPKKVINLMNVWQKMDGRCRQLAISNPSRQMSDYCDKCKELFKKALGD